MKKTYEAPTVGVIGDAVLETKGPSGSPEAPNGFARAPGSVGFNL